MKVIITNTLLLAFITTSARALVARDSGVICTAVCRPVKPVCPPGQAPTGNAACWGCCAPAAPVVTDPPTVCTEVCNSIKPVCPVGQTPTGSEGCWGCCVPVGDV